MTSTRHSEEAWAVVLELSDGEPMFDDGVLYDGGSIICATFKNKTRAKKYAELRDWKRCNVPFSIQRVRISTIGAKGRRK